MGRTHDALTPELVEWLGAQRLFFVATAPAAGGHVNLSPKGHDTFRVLGPTRVGYLDLTGSGVETIAHLRDDGRMTMMWCAFEGPPRILRLYGRGEFHLLGSPGFEALAPQFPSRVGMRSIITMDVERISSSCGFSIPFLAYTGERDTLDRWAERQGDDGLEQYWAERNASSIDGLPGLT